MSTTTPAMLEMLKFQAIDPYCFDMETAIGLSSDTYYRAFLTGMTDESIRIRIRDFAYGIRNATKLETPMLQAVSTIYEIYLATGSKELNHDVVCMIRIVLY